MAAYVRPCHELRRNRVHASARVLLVATLTVAALSVALLAGAGPSAAGARASAAGSRKPRLVVVTSFYPMYIETINVANGVEGVSVSNLTAPQTGCLHDYQFTTGDMKKLQQADALVINGAGMEAFVTKVVAQLPSMRVIEASKGLKLLKGSDGQSNPHVWVSISQAMLQVKAIALGLAKADPAHAKQYAANRQAYVARLEAQRARMHRLLDPLKSRDIITFHEAFPYFAAEFGLHILAVIEREPGSEPSAAELARTIDVVRAAKCKALFAEPQYPVKAAATIAKETGAKVFQLDPAVMGDTDPDAYIRTMEANLQVLLKALRT